MFVGANSIIMYDTKIGSNVVVAAGSILTKDIPDDVIVAGVTAKVIGRFESLLNKRIQETNSQYVDGMPKYYRRVDANAEWDKFYLKRSSIDN